MDRELLLEIGVEELPASWLPALTRAAGRRSSQARLDEARPRRRDARVESLQHAAPADGVRRRSSPSARKIATRRSRARRCRPRSTPRAIRRRPRFGFAKKARRRLRRARAARHAARASTSPYRTPHRAAERRSTCCRTCSAALLRDLTFPKQMHWDAQLDDGKGELLFGRPIRWLLFLYGGRVVPFTIARHAERVEPARAGRHVRRRDLRPPVPRDERPRRAARSRCGRFDEYRKQADRELRHARRASNGAIAIARELEAQARTLGGRAMLQQRPQSQALLEEVPDLVEYPAVVAGAFGARVPRAAGRSADDDADSSSALLSGGRRRTAS